MKAIILLFMKLYRVRYRYIYLISKLVLLLLSVMHLSSCSWFTGGDKKISSSHNANFIVEQITAQVNVSRKNGLPEEVQVTYNTCIKDDHMRDPVANILFKIHFMENFKTDESTLASEDIRVDKTSDKQDDRVEDHSALVEDVFQEAECTSSKMVSMANREFTGRPQYSCIAIPTDADGCLKWTEVYSYEAIGEALWFPYVRVFEGQTTVAKGRTAVPLLMSFHLSDPQDTSSEFQLRDRRYLPLDNKTQLAVFNAQHMKQSLSQCRRCVGNIHFEDQDNNDQGQQLDLQGQVNINFESMLRVEDPVCRQCFLKQGSLSHVLSYYHQTKHPPRLWINDLNYRVRLEDVSILDQDILKKLKVCTHRNNQQTCDPLGRVLHVNLRIPLKIKITNHLKEEAFLLLDRGKYFIQPYFYLKSGGENIMLHRPLDLIETDLQSGSGGLEVEFHLHIPYENLQSDVHPVLALKVKSDSREDGREIFLPFEGAFDFDSGLKNSIGSDALSLRSTDAEEFYNNLESQSQVGASPSAVSSSPEESSFVSSLNLVMDVENNKDREGFEKAGWSVDLKRMRHSGLTSPSASNLHLCYNAVKQTINYIGEVCIEDQLTKDPISTTDIQISIEDRLLDGNGNMIQVSDSQQLDKKAPICTPHPITWLFAVDRYHDVQLV